MSLIVSELGYPKMTVKIEEQMMISHWIWGYPIFKQSHARGYVMYNGINPRDTNS